MTTKEYRNDRTGYLGGEFDTTAKDGYASEVLQYRFDLNQVKPNWVMMFPKDKTNELPGRGAEEQHDPEKG